MYASEFSYGKIFCYILFMKSYKTYCYLSQTSNVGKIITCTIFRISHCTNRLNHVVLVIWLACRECSSIDRSIKFLRTEHLFQIQVWTANPNQFVEDEDDDTFSYSVRIAAQDVLLVSAWSVISYFT